MTTPQYPDKVIYKGIVFRRYPNAKQFSHRMYYRPHIGYCKKGVQHLHQEIWKDANGPIPKGYEIHHKDNNPLNNDITNLECKEKSKHLKEHGVSRRGVFTERHRNQLLDASKKAISWHKSEEGIKWHKLNAKQCWVGRKPSLVPCAKCGKEHESYYPKRTPQFCSTACSQAMRKELGKVSEERICIVCSKPFTTNKYRNRRTCNRACYNISHMPELIRSR